MTWTWRIIKIARGEIGEGVVRCWPQRTHFYFWGFLRLCQLWWKSIKKCDRESAHRRIHTLIDWQTHTGFVICPMLYAIAMGQMTIILIYIANSCPAFSCSAFSAPRIDHMWEDFNIQRNATYSHTDRRSVACQSTGSTRFEVVGVFQQQLHTSICNVLPQMLKKITSTSQNKYSVCSCAQLFICCQIEETDNKNRRTTDIKQAQPLQATICIYKNRTVCLFDPLCVGMSNGRNADRLYWQSCHTAEWWLAYADHAALGPHGAIFGRRYSVPSALTPCPTARANVDTGHVPDPVCSAHRPGLAYWPALSPAKTVGPIGTRTDRWARPPHPCFYHCVNEAMCKVQS